MMNAVSIDLEHRPCLDDYGGARAGSEPRKRALPGKEFAMPTGRIAMDVVEEVLRMRHGCGRTLTEALSKRHPSGASVASLDCSRSIGTVFTFAGIRTP